MLLLAALIVLAAAISAQAQTCTPPLWQGSVNATGSCNRLVVRWLNRDSISLIDHFTVRWLTDGLTHTLPANAIQDVRDDIYCQWASHVTITQFNKNGSVCFVNSTGAAPHTPSCDLCSGQQSPLGVVNSASGRGYSTADSLLTAYGQNLTTVTATASTKPFPTNLGGLQVWIDDQPCGLSFVSPLQANFYAPAGIRAGLRTVRATNAAGQSFFGDIFIQTQGFDLSPGLREHVERLFRQPHHVERTRVNRPNQGHTLDQFVARHGEDHALRHRRLVVTAAAEALQHHRDAAR